MFSPAFWRKLEEMAPLGLTLFTRNAHGSCAVAGTSNTLLCEDRKRTAARLLPRSRVGILDRKLLSGHARLWDKGNRRGWRHATDADGVTVFDFWQAQDQARNWAERQRLIAAGVLRADPYKVADAVKDYLSEIAAEKKPAAVQGAKYVFDAWILPDLGSLQVDRLTTDRLVRWRNKIATEPKRVRTKRTASEPARRQTPDDEDARRARKATANRILTMLKASLNRAFYADRVSSDSVWRKVKPFKRVDEAVVRYLSLEEIRRLVDACPEDFRKLVEAALYTGCRYAELACLKYEDYNNDSGTLSVRLSKGKNRHVVLTDEGKVAFRRWTIGHRSGERIFLRTDGRHWGHLISRDPSMTRAGGPQ